MVQRYESEQDNLAKEIERLKQQLADRSHAADGAAKWIEIIKNYAEIIDLDAEIVNTLIDKITVSEAQIVDGQKLQAVNIYYKFVGQVE